MIMLTMNMSALKVLYIKLHRTLFNCFSHYFRKSSAHSPISYHSKEVLFVFCRTCVIWAQLLLDEINNFVCVLNQAVLRVSFFFYSPLFIDFLVF